MESIRTDEEVIAHIKQILDEYVAPAVAQHGGIVNFVKYEDNVLTLELSGSCSGCAGSTYTLQMGIETLIREHIPEVDAIEAVHDSAYNTPYYSYDNTFYDADFDPQLN